MRPAAARTSPEIVLSVVVFPAPLAPMRQTNSAAPTVSETESSAATRP